MHPTVTPRVITRFEPWMALSFSDGSIGPDFERVNLNQLEAFYSLRATAYDSYLPSLAEQIPALLRAWDFRWGATSIPTSLAVYWGEEVGRRTDGEAMLQALSAASDKLARDFGTWKTPWGDINRFQRLAGDIVQPFNDAGPSIPVGFTASRWGSLASFGARTYTGTKKMYGTTGNSFVAVVEFGDCVKARAGVGGRGERRSEVAAFQRSGCAVQHGRSQKRVLLPRGAGGTHRAAVSSRPLTRAAALLRRHQR